VAESKAEVLAGLRADLAAEQDSVEGLVSGLDEAGWATPTPAAGWTVQDQISHLASVDGWATTACSDPAVFTAWMAGFGPDPGGEAVVDEAVERSRSLSGPEVLSWWRAGRTRFFEVVEGLAPDVRVPWFGPPMSLPMLLTARLMETWAHGTDIANALGVTRVPTIRLRHVAHLGVRTRAYSYAVRGRTVPPGEVRVELDGPGGERWVWGDDGAADQVRGPALDFCLVVARRRHPSDTALVVEGPAATEWLAIAQAFAGPPGTDPAPMRPGSP
jgi:uncharacterized protein (TIGR03084 family)